jgi:hypothetical protein
VGHFWQAPKVSTRGATNAKLAFPIAVLVIALVTVSAACVARCVGLPCHGATEAASVPPCHKEKPSKVPTESCKQSVLVAAAVDSLTLTKAATVHLAAIAIPAAEAALPFPAIESRVVAQRTSPPGSPELQFSVVRRI